jgi:RIO-like serine/threonine protein kinase
MELVKENIEKKRRVYKVKDTYRKVWDNVTPDWVENHVTILNSIMPNYVVGYGDNYVQYRVIEGVPANKITHTDEFCKRIYQYCLKQIQDTRPWAHGDWVLSNMIVNGDTITMIDWDNVGCYSRDEITKKLHSDLHSAFGDRFTRILNDTASV